MDEAIKKSDKNTHYIVLSTAHPAKFPKVYEDLGMNLSNIPKALTGVYMKNLRDCIPLMQNTTKLLILLNKITRG